MKNLVGPILFSVLALCACTSCHSPTGSDYIFVKVPLRGLIIPGRINPGENAVVKYIWHGGGCLRSIAYVEVNRSDRHIIITPFGKYLTGGTCPADVWTRIDAVSLGALAAGTYTVIVVGDTTSYRDSLTVPTAASDSLFQFNVTTVDPETGAPVGGIQFYVRLFPPADTTLEASTDSSGVSVLTYPSVGVDSLQYELGFSLPPGYLGFTQARIGQPEIITLGVR